jgi:hypothetical protein
VGVVEALTAMRVKTPSSPNHKPDTVLGNNVR